VTDIESSSGATVHSGVQAGIDIMADSAVDVSVVRPAPLFGDSPHLGTQAQCSYSSSQSTYAFQDKRGQPMPPDHFPRRQDVPTGVRQPPLQPRADVFARPPAPPLTDQYAARQPPAAPPLTTADLISVHTTRLPSEPERVATVTTTYGHSTTTPIMPGRTTTTVTPTVYAYTQPRPDCTTPPVSTDNESSSSSDSPVLSGQRDIPAQPGLLTQRVRHRTASRTPSHQSSSDALGLARQLADSIQNQLQQADARELRTVQALEKQRDDSR